jgi:N-methylhydantoinase A
VQSSAQHENGSSPTGGFTVGVDIGGTFTDLVAVATDGSMSVAKVSSTPHNSAEGVAAGLVKLGIAGTEIGHFAHGTTAAINAILTKSGAPTGLITTNGFRDVFEIRRSDRGEMFNYWWRAPEPLVPRHNRLEVTERVAFDGTVVNPLAEDEIATAVEQLRARGVESVAICFLNSFVNPVHELRAKEIVQELWPEAYVCASADIAPEILEFERTSTTVANAYVGPIMEGYLGSLRAHLDEIGCRQELLIMSSAGHAMTVDTALEVPVSTAVSGIAAGVMAGAALSRAAERPNLLTLDVGGTSSDIALIWDSRPRITTEWDIEFGLPIRQPAVDIHTLGAGGGSIARVDAGGVLHVGPESAGADPGPACYGKGVGYATTTDAQVVLGRIDRAAWERLYGWPLDVAAAQAAIREQVCKPLGLDLVDAAAAILDVAVNNLVEGIRLVSVQRGYDPRELSLAGYGGAGPMYAVDVARALEIPHVLIPPAPGVTSALGLLQVDVAVHGQRSVLLTQENADAERIDALFRELEHEACQKLARSGYDDVQVRRQVDVRYFGQSQYLTVDVPTEGRWTDGDLDMVIAAFNDAHEREYGYTMPPHISRVELANLRIIATHATEHARIAPGEATEQAPGSRSVYFRETGFSEVPTYDRASLAPGAGVTGPAIIDQADSTTVVPPGAEVEVDREGNLVISARAVVTTAGGRGATAEPVLPDHD